eukprot:113252_1
MSQESKIWCDLKPPPEDDTIDLFNGDIISITDNEFLIAAGHFCPDDHEHLYKYNIHLNEWELFIEYPDDTCFCGLQLAFNQNTSKLYILDEMNTLSVVDTKTKQWTMSLQFINYNSEIADDNYWNARDLQILGSGFITANGNIHSIGGTANKNRYHIRPDKPTHFIWNDVTKLFEHNYSFEEYNVNFYPNVVHIPSKNILL